MNPDLNAPVRAFIAQENLPHAYLETVEQWFLPMLEEMLGRIAAHQGTYVIGVSGCQGSGKSTLAALVVLLLKSMMGLRAVNLSIDDFYLTHAERQALAGTVHPLLATRGVPGTHDVSLAMETLASLREAGHVSVPRFDKSVDDRAPASTWPRVTAPVDVIVLEGWCLSIGPQDETALVEPVNDLERREDPDGAWRRYVNQAIAGRYQDFYRLVDYLVFLQAPDFSKVYEWRQRQEDKLAARTLDKDNARLMSPSQLQRFIQHYERVTRHGLLTLPAKADTVFKLTDAQTIDRKV